MKKILLSLLLIASVNLVFAQQTLPCNTDYKINNGGGNCPDTVLNGATVPATGSVTLTFDGTVNPNNIPSILSVLDITDPSNPVPVTDITFGPGELNPNGTVTYCYYVGPNNNNNLLGHHAKFRFTVYYGGDPDHPIFCGSQIPLPVSFHSFTATRSNNTVALKWVTAAEVNNLGFEIQRLIGSGNWQTLSFVPTNAAAGNSASDLSYTYTDQNPIKGISQYRIKQIDIDQKLKYSEIRAVRGIGQLVKMIIYPNPSVTGKVNVVFDEAEGIRDVSLLDIYGRIIKQWKNITNNNLQIENLTPGIYSLRVVVRETGDQVVEKIVVNNR